ncbi:MAG TPA: hypothetical protein PLK79_01735, partial [Thermoleophilia bacterium]|nr:hypothetical protein [Thermoleophilia bacterium]
ATPALRVTATPAARVGGAPASRVTAAPAARVGGAAPRRGGHAAVLSVRSAMDQGYGHPRRRGTETIGVTG